jgi:mRNA-degrading endonuclease RelE of RelBE toxin-antitoxin system
MRVGDYRVIYTINDKTRLIDITAVRHRRDAYK